MEVYSLTNKCLSISSFNHGSDADSGDSVLKFININFQLKT